MFRRYLTFLKIARDEFSGIVVDAELCADRVRLILIDGSWIDIRYPVEEKYSFHWQKYLAFSFRKGFSFKETGLLY
jgi:hypothetical protein